MPQVVEREVDLGKQVDVSHTKAPYRSLLGLPFQEQRDRVRKLGSDRMTFVVRNLPDSYLPPAILGEPDDDSFRDTSWTRDIEETIAPAVDPYVRRYFPELTEVLDAFYLKYQRRLLQRYAWENEWWRFDQRPQQVRDSNVMMVHDDLAPTTKAMVDGRRVEDWSHNQLDALARVLSVSADGIKQGIPLLAQTPDDIRPTGEVLLKMAFYTSNQIGPNNATHGIWENKHCLIPGSTKAALNQGHINTFKIHRLLQQDSQQRNYPLHITTPELAEATYQGVREQNSEFPYEWTTPYGHPQPADLSQLKTCVDVKLPSSYIEIILKQTESLEGELGYIRFEGDTWRKEREHAYWAIGLLYRIYTEGQLATMWFNHGNKEQAQSYLTHSLLMYDRTAKMIHEYGKLPELHYQDPEDDFKFKPNKNDLAWGEMMVGRASAVMVGALQAAEQSSLIAA